MLEWDTDQAGTEDDHDGGDAGGGRQDGQGKSKRQKLDPKLGLQLRM
jgi:hypothetical protein